jgi:hypothetical protein
MGAIIGRREIEMGEQFFPQVEIDRIVYEGFASSGWVVVLRLGYYVEDQQMLTENKKHAIVFKNLCTAIAVCETFQYFHCCDEFKVITVTDSFSGTTFDGIYQNNYHRKMKSSKLMQSP